MNNPLLTETIGVYFINMDNGINEQVVCNVDGSFTILINARQNNERQMLSYRHAIEHIMNDDFNMDDADNAELIGHRLK